MMRFILNAGIIIMMSGLFSATLFPACLWAQSDGDSMVLPDGGWPQVVQSSDNTITIYQPQIESWQDNLLKARSAVSVTTKASAQPEFGVVFFSARTEVDRSSGIVTFMNTTISSVNFPKSGKDTLNYTDIIKSSIPKWPQTIALERLIADMAVTQAEMKTQQRTRVKNDPPRLLISTRPAVLVLIDGTPVPRAIGGTSLMRIINTRALILLDKTSGKYYLYLSDHWEEAQNIEGPWIPAKNQPASLADALDDARQSKAVDLLEKDTKSGTKFAGPLRVYVSTQPAELIITQGKPNLQPIDGTQILSCTNSDNDIFFYLKDQRYYVLIAGRWYRSRVLEKGPWEFVPGSSLPHDFANIPENHNKGNVLASVPGTPEAEEAVISNSIPQTATVKRSEAKADITYDGDPVFKPIEGTPLKYAVNSPVPVIKVDEKSFYSVINGVWFGATSPFGPWAVADRIPAVIYTIPPSSPVHYVVYVRVYGSTPEVVYVGYTSGYYGALIGIDGTVVYGTGYYYDPWIGTVWYGPPVTWGFGVCYGWHVWGWGWGWGYYYGWRPIFRPWWGPMWGWGAGWWHPWGWRGGIKLHANVYSHWRSNIIVQNNIRSFRNQASFRGRANDHFAGRDGQVYRRTAEGRWERHIGEGRWTRFDNHSRFEGERFMRGTERLRDSGGRRSGESRGGARGSHRK